MYCISIPAGVLLNKKKEIREVSINECIISLQYVEEYDEYEYPFLPKM